MAHDRLLMKRFSILLALVASIVSRGALASHAQEPVVIEFPELGPTLLELATGKKVVPTLMYQLPDNFEEGKEYPVFVFLSGGTGGGQKSGGLQRARTITGGRDFIAVSLPNYRNTTALDSDALFEDLLIGVDDYPAIEKAYTVMFAKFFATVPQARKSGNVMGGFSNGAHITSVLLSCQDPTTLKHFSNFIFADGGIWLSGLQRQSMKKCRFLGLYGDTDTYWTRPVIIQQFQTMKATADAQKIDFELIVMEGTGHRFPAEYDDQVWRWIQHGFSEAE